MRYPTQREASKALTKLLHFRAVHGMTDRMEIRAYSCQRCDGWHTTSMDWGGA